jgi:hypothetical protein
MLLLKLESDYEGFYTISVSLYKKPKYKEDMRFYFFYSILFNFNFDDFYLLKIYNEIIFR